MARVDAVRPLLVGLAAGCCAAALHAQVPAARSSDPAAALMPPASTAPVSPTAGGLPASRWTAAQLQEAFVQADANGDGQLTRAEAQQLKILPRSFEDLDANKDGVLTGAEYLAGAV